MKYSGVLGLIVCVVFGVTSTATRTTNDSPLELNATSWYEPPCFSEPFVKYENGSNSTHECFLSQFHEQDTTSINSIIVDCNQGNNRNCFFIGNTKETSPGLGYEYYIGVRNTRVTSERPDESNAFKHVRMANGYWGLQHYIEKTCLDAYWRDYKIYLHSHVCSAYNPNQYWNVQEKWGVQLIQHAIYTEYCLQVNGYTTTPNKWAVIVTKCNWNVLEQQISIFFRGG